MMAIRNRKLKPAGTVESLPAFHPIVKEWNAAGEPERKMIELALREAEALAWTTGLPELVFIDLAEEKFEALKTWRKRQELVRGRSIEWALAA